MSKNVTDLRGKAGNGYLPLLAGFLLLAASAYIGWNFVFSFSPEVNAYSTPIDRMNIHWAGAGVSAALFVASMLSFSGLYTLGPNESVVLTLFSDYAGTDDVPGLRWTNPFYGSSKLSLKLHNQQIDSIKVNDAAGNPIEIGAIVTWHVKDSAKAALTVDNYAQFVKVQIESALRTVASKYSYDNWSDRDHDGEDAPKADDAARPSLRDSGEQVAVELAADVRRRVARAGVEIEDARITHLAYAPEIAQAMLRRQQAAAVLAARTLLLKGSVGLVKEVIDDLKKKNIEIDAERQAAMISNLLVVMVSDKEASPVTNVGSLYT